MIAAPLCTAGCHVCHVLRAAMLRAAMLRHADLTNVLAAPICDGHLRLQASRRKKPPPPPPPPPPLPLT